MLVPPSTVPVFIGYRRLDTRHAAARLRDSLMALGHPVWLDVEDMEATTPYRAQVTRVLRECEVVLILIGPQWLTASDRDGHQRLADPEDDVRMEVELALGRSDVTVVPVLVDNTDMPSREDLPAELRQLCELNGARLSHETWKYQVRALHETIQGAARRGWAAWGEAVVIAAIAAVPAAAIAARHDLRTDPIRDAATTNLARLSVQRAAMWAVIMAALLAWVALRRPGGRWAPALRAGLLWGAAFGLVGAIVHGVPTYVVDQEAWVGLGLDPAAVPSVRITAYALGVAVTGAGIGALIGAAWNPPGVARGLVAGFVAGAFLGWLVRAHLGGAATQTKVLTSILVAVGIVGAIVATQWSTRAGASRPKHL